MLYNIIYKAENENKTHWISVDLSCKIEKTVRELEKQGFKVLYVENPYGY